MVKQAEILATSPENATGAVAIVRQPGAWIDGMIGVAIFSASLAATRLALTGMDALFPQRGTGGTGRAGGGGRAADPARGVAASRRSRGARDRAGGVVVGFPLLTALALRTVGAAHGTVFVGLLPLSTALFGALRSGERPSAAFWVLSVLGALVTVGFAARGLDGPPGPGDAFMLAAILVCGLGYAEGGSWRAGSAAGR